MISIIIPVYNHAKKLSECLDSIINQTYNNFEIIVVNDGSKDNFYEVAGKYKKILGQKIEILEQENSGANVARNHGARFAKGEFIIFCDADIIMEPKMLEIMHSELKNHPEVSYCYSSFKWGLKTFKLWPFDGQKLKQMPYIHTTSLIKREHFIPFDENLKRLQDWDLLLSMLEQNHTGLWINQILFKVQTGGTMSSWLPSFVYKLLPFLPKVKKYNQAVRVIKEKHHLN